MSLRTSLSVAALVLLVAGPLQAESRSRFVRVPSASLAEAGDLGLTPRVATDYGSFRWLELSGDDYRRLAESGVAFTEAPGAGQIQVLGYRFDPLADGEPTIPEGLEAVGSGGLELVQMSGPVRSEWLSELKAAGLKPLQYYPSNTYLVWDGGAGTEASLPFVRWRGAFHPAYKIAPDLAGRQGVISRLQVIFVDDGNVGASADAIARAAGVPLVSLRPAQPDKALWSAQLEADAGVLETLAQLPSVLWMGYRSPRPQLEDEMSDQIVAGNYPGGVPPLGYESHLASLGVDGTGVIWSICDTGVDYDHPDLGPHIVGGFSVTGTTCNPPGQPGSDCAGGGHGTHVAGIVGADATGGFTDANGYFYGLGVAPGYSIYTINIFGSGGDFPDFSQLSVLAGSVGSNNSWTTGEGTAHGYQASERTYDIMVRDGDFDTTDVAEPHIVVFSAGNSGPGAMTLTAPKEAKNVIVTAGTQNYRTSSNIDAMYVSSSRGPAVDGRYVPTIAAPGQTIASTRNDLGGSCASAISGTNGLYAFCTGTSMASPQASGAVVLITEWWRNRTGGSDPSPAMAKALLVNNAVDITGAPAIPNFDEGWGRIQVTAAIHPAASTKYFDQETLFDGTGQSWSLDVEPAPGMPLKVSLAWTDAPGALGANPALVNDLDLTVENGGNTYLGNHFSLGASTTGGSSDTLNNLENVFVTAPVSGPTTITVDATAINGDAVPYNGTATDQDFALVCQNCRLSMFKSGFETGDTSEWSSVVSDG
ncbi:MAG: S8 family serine peptidase [Acidobacteria bacterium]|nr:S8 family serine peptidase [Acidobacteriota bacterium]